jgi:DNA-directed RNA polymerase III subunit RPC2
MSYISAIANMTKIQSQMEKTMKITGPRVLQSSHWGMLCASDTPEGEKCGLTKNLALLTHITITHETENILQLCLYLGLEDMSLMQLDYNSNPNLKIVFLNG